MSQRSEEGPDPKNSGFRIRHVGSILAPWRKMLIVIGSSVMLGAVLELAPPFVVRHLVDDQLTQGRSDGLLLLAALYLAAVASSQALGFVTDYVTAIVAQGSLHLLRVRLFAHLQRLPISYFDRTPLGDTISRCTADVEAVGTLFSPDVAGGGSSGATVLTNLVRLVTISAAMAVLSLPLFLVTLVAILPLVGLSRFFQVRVRRAERANRLATGLQNSHLQETISGIRVIRSMGRETAFAARFREALRQGIMAYNRSTVYSANYQPIVNMLAATATAVVLWFGAGDLVRSLGISLGTLTGYVLLFQRFIEPISALGDQLQTVQAGFSGLERIFEVLSLTPEPSPERLEYDARSQPAIEMRNVIFGYTPEVPVLQDVTVVVGRGEHVALVGRTGAGKTSSMQLLGGLYSPWSGAVTVSGVDPRTLSEDVRRRAVGVVPQVVQLFSGTVLENLTLGDESLSMEAVERSTALAGVDGLIQQLPDGYQTVIGKGAELSAGQQQLLALARAIVWQPSVLLMDEATAALDSATEAAFRSALHRVVEERGIGVLTVAHRLSTAREADRVMVMESGRIVEDGSPAELIKRGGRFAALLELEAAGWDWKAI